MNREKTAWIVSLILIAMLAFQLPGTLAHRDDDYAFVKALIDVHRQVSANYVDPVDEEKLRTGSVNGMMAELDPYSIFIPAAKTEEFDNLLEGSFKGVGIQLAQLENGEIEVVSPIPDSPAHKAGVMAGDVIVKVNGDDIKGKKIDEVQKMVKGPLGTEVRLTVRRTDGKEADLKMTRQEIVMPTVMGYRRDAGNNWEYWVSKDPKVAYIRITQFTADTFKELRKALDKTVGHGLQGLILDLRFNPGGRLDQAKSVVNLFVSQGVIVVTKGLHRTEEIARAKPEDSLPRQFPMIVLVNEHSASAAEIVAGSLKDNKRALIMGTRTYGKGSVQEIIPLEPDEGELKLTVAYYYLPSGRLVHKKKGATDWGVDPNVVVPMSDKVEAQVYQEQGEQELFHKPLPATTRAATTKAATTQSARNGATTQPVVDAQLQEAVTTIVDSIKHNGEKQLIPTTLPASSATTQVSRK
jgi:carboxyl-terminal processing protease